MLNGTEASTFCSYCNSPTIVFDRVSKQLRPKKIIPFKVTKEQALDYIRESFDNGKYVPEKIRALTVEDIRGIYIPFWLYNTFIRRGMRIETRIEDKGKVAFFRDASCRFSHLTLDASLNLSNELSQRLEPYNMDELVDFEEAYLAGFYADKFNVPRKAVASIAKERCRKYLDKIILSSVPVLAGSMMAGLEPTNYKIKNVKEEYRVISIEYALLPAYFVSICYKEGNQLLMANGQTGKVVGSLPIEKEQLRKAYIPKAIGCSIFFTIFSVISCLLLPNTIPILAILIIFAIGGLIVGNHSYKKYKMNWYRLNANSLRKYVNDREEA